MDEYSDAQDCMKTWKCSSKFPGLGLDLITQGVNIVVHPVIVSQVSL